MADLTAVRFTHNDQEYELTLSFDDEAIVQQSLTFEISAARWPVGAPDARSEIGASVSIERNLMGQPILQICVGEWSARLAIPTRPPRIRDHALQRWRQWCICLQAFN